MESEDLLWQRVVAFRGIELPKRGDRLHITGERFEVQVTGARASSRGTGRVARVEAAPAYRGVVGEIVSTRSPAGPLGWRHGLIATEAERLARLQPERRARRA